MEKVEVIITESYRYKIELEVYDNETIEDALHEVDLLIDRDKEWLNQKREAMSIQSEFEWKEADGDTNTLRMETNNG